MKTLHIANLILCLGLLASNSSGVPLFNKQPSPLTNSVSLGVNLTNSAVASSSNPPLSYQWQLNGNPLPGATNTILVLTNIQVSNAGSYVLVSTDTTGSVPSRPWVIDVDATFTKIISSPVVAALGQATGAAWGDYNNDGNQDLYLSILGKPGALFTNNGYGTFTRITNGPIALDSGAAAGAAWGDFDNDGFLDLFVSVNGAGNDFLYHNTGQGTFTKVVAGAIVGSGGNGNGCAWADYNNDGYLDLYVCNSDQNNFLYLNNRNGTFTRITTNQATINTGNSQGCAWGDYDNDGYPDLFVARFGANNLLLHNDHNGGFTRITNQPPALDSSGGPCVWVDYDNDGFLDLFANGSTSSKNLLYHNNGNGTFTKMTAGPVVSAPIGNNGGCVWFDFDNDGWLDLFIPLLGNPNLFFHNNGDGTFTRITTGSLVTDGGEGVGAAWADYDNDGFPDLFVSNINSHAGFLYHNNGNSNQWLTVQCLGRLSNRAAIGAKVRIKATIHGKTFWQMREISGGGGLGSQNDLRVQFGLGDATNVDVVRVEWPSGIVQELTNVPAKQFLTVREQSRLRADYSPASGEFHVTIGGGKGLNYLLETSSDLTSWTSVASVSNLTGNVTWTNQVAGWDFGRYFRARE